MKNQDILKQLAAPPQEADRRRVEDAEPLSYEGIRHFFEECNFDPYSKEELGPDSYRVVGSPVHGGYAHNVLEERSADDRETDQ